MRKTRLLSILALLLMAVSGAWAQTETLLTTITPTGKDTYSETTAGVVTVTLSNVRRYSGDYGWIWRESGSVTVEAKEGYTITKCVFKQNSKTPVTITTSPFAITFNENGECEQNDDNNMNGVTSIEVYGPAAPAPAATGYTVTMAEGTEDAANWTIEPNAGLNGGETVTVTYNGTKRIQSITAVKKAAAPAVQARTWNFTQWSEATVNNIKADAAASKTEGWSDIEKEKDAKDGKSAGETEDKCFWYQGEINSDGTLSANGSVIEELKGLKFNEEYASRRDLAIAVDYSSTSLGDYAGGAYLMLGGGKVSSPDKRICCFTIPNVKIGQKITVVVESHKPSTGRGISLFVNSVKDDGNKIGDSFMPTTKESYTWENWTLPDGVTADGDTVDILVYNNDVCHIYSITVE